MTCIEYSLRIAFGWICYWIVMAWPVWLPCMLKVAAHAGFYAYSDGYENHLRRLEAS